MKGLYPAFARKFNSTIHGLHNIIMHLTVFVAEVCTAHCSERRTINCENILYPYTLLANPPKLKGLVNTHTTHIFFHSHLFCSFPSTHIFILCSVAGSRRADLDMSKDWGCTVEYFFDFFPLKMTSFYYIMRPLEIPCFLHMIIKCMGKYCSLIKPS